MSLAVPREEVQTCKGILSFKELILMENSQIVNRACFLTKLKCDVGNQCNQI